MKKLKIFEIRQESTYRYTGITSFKNLLEVTADYPFDEEVMEKAEIHKRNMSAPFSVTLRLEPETVLTEHEDGAEFSFETYDIRDGRSKCAAIGLLEPEDMEENLVKLDIFLLDKEKMDML